MENDLSNVRLMERLAGTLVPSGLDADHVFDEVAARLREELDYRIEAAHQSRFALLHQGTQDVVIPRLISSHSARRVITTEMFRGHTLEDVLRDASPVQRCGYATTLWRFVFCSILVAGEFNADPHPGNYLFGVSPQIAFLDFGCVQRLSAVRRMALRAVDLAAARRDEAGFVEAVRVLLETKRGCFESVMIGFTRLTFEPLFASPFHITRDYLRSLFDYARRSKFEILRARGAVTPFPPSWP